MTSRSEQALAIVRASGNVVCGSQLHDAMRRKHAVTGLNARKIASRAVNERSLRQVSLGNQALYLPPKVTVHDVRRGPLLRAIKGAHPGLYRACLVLADNSVISVGEFVKIAAARVQSSLPPIDHPLIATAVGAELAAVRPEQGLMVARKPLVQGDVPGGAIIAATSRLEMQRTLLADLVEFLRRTNTVAWRCQTAQARGGAVPYCGSYWDLATESWSRGIRRQIKGKRPARPVFGDAVWGREYSAHDLAAFEDRLEHAYHSRRQDNEPMAVVFTHWLSQSLHKRVKQGAYILYTFEQLYGQRALEEIEGLSQVISAQTPDLKEMQRVLKGLSDLDRLADFGNVLALLFEYITADYIRKTGYSDQERRLMLTKSNDRVREDMELDLVARLGNDVMIIECKGYRADSLVPASDVRKFLDHKFHPACNALRQRYPAATFRPLIATSSALDDDAREYLADWTEKHKRRFGTHDILLERETLIEELRRVGGDGANILHEFYS